MSRSAYAYSREYGDSGDRNQINTRHREAFNLRAWQELSKRKIKSRYEQSDLDQIVPIGNRIDGVAPVYEGQISLPNLLEQAPLVDKERSHGFVTSKADNLLAQLPDNQYNCHFYTATVIFGHIPQLRSNPHESGLKVAVGINEPFLKTLNDQWVRCHISYSLSKNTLKECGYKPIHPECAQAGDIALVVDGQDSNAFAYRHSAVVLGRHADGTVIYRQKFDENRPVVDLTDNQFARVYTSHGEKLEIWRKN